MNYKLYKGENGKQYWVGVEKISPLPGGENYEVKYQEFKQGKTDQEILLGAWEIDSWHKADSGTDAILQAKEKLRQKGIIL